jgi:hypothetical protein
MWTAEHAVIAVPWVPNGDLPQPPRIDHDFNPRVRLAFAIDVLLVESTHVSRCR